MNQEIIDTFKDKTKEQIEVILDFFRMPLKLSSKKTELLMQLAELLGGDPVKWLSGLLEYDLRILQRLCTAGPETSVKFLKPDYPSIVEVLRLVNSCEPDGQSLELSLPLAIYNIVKPHIDKVIEEREKEGLFDVERMVLGCLNIYGVIPLPSFVDKIFGDMKDEKEAAKLTEKVAACPLIRIYQESHGGEAYIVSPFVDNLEEILKFRRGIYKGKSYSKMSKEEAISCGRNAPFCAFGTESKEGQALKDTLQRLGYCGEELHKQLHTVWMAAQYAVDEEATEILFSPVTDKMDEIPSFKEFSECIQSIVDYANVMPKWALKGHNSLKTDRMKLSIKTDELKDEFDPVQDVPAVLDDTLDMFYDMGLAIRRAEPDEPCPCGSGISYRFCHGKYVC